MDGPRDYHTECSESDEDRYDTTHMWIQKVIEMYQHTKQTHRYRQQTHGSEGGKEAGMDELGVWR